jgi:hypothetical protein
LTFIELPYDVASHLGVAFGWLNLLLGIVLLFELVRLLQGIILHMMRYSCFSLERLVHLILVYRVLFGAVVDRIHHIKLLIMCDFAVIEDTQELLHITVFLQLGNDLALVNLLLLTAFPKDCIDQFKFS